MEARKPQTAGSRMKPELPWHSRFDLLGITFLLFLLGALGALPSIEGSGRDLDYWGNLSRFSSQFFPPDWSILDRTLEGLLETVQIALVSTLLSIVISIMLSIGAARTIAPLWLLWPTRMLLNLIRTIPSLLWALLAVVIVGSNPLAGVIALTFYSVGYLAKFFSETFEAANTDAQQALRSLGASPLQAFQYGLWPNARPIIWSHCLWMLEYNVRSASIIGYVGAGGIGLHLKLYAESADSWNKFSLVLLCILVIVTVLDFTGEKIRQSIREKLEGKKSN
jgi:phosphonate transport system permease protein